MNTKRAKNNKKQRKTKKNYRLSSSFVNPASSHTNIEKSKIVVNFFEMLNLIKLYHWKTKVFSQHKATDKLHEQLSENIDRFVEVLLGKDESRIKMLEKNMKLMDSEDETDFKSKIFGYRAYLIDLDKLFDEKKDSDLRNIRDEMLANVNQFLYLLTFD
jgi:DNA-binding ferritin-like protein